MNFFAWIFHRPEHSAAIAERRLKAVLETERALTGRKPKRAVPASDSSELPAPLQRSALAREQALAPRERYVAHTTRGSVRLVRRSVNSGEMIQHSGTLMVLGDVQPAAEVIADGDIIIYGRLRGVAHAGVGGDESAIIAALTFKPTQARIGTRLLSGKGVRRRDARTPELARIKGEQIVIERWAASSNMTGKIGLSS